MSTTSATTWAWAAVLLLTAGCSSGSVSKSEREADRELSRRVLEAMCTPWGIKREDALAALIEAAQNPALAEPPTNDFISDIAGDVTEEDCRKAGFDVLDPPIIEAERLRRRCRWAHITPPPAPSPADQKRIDASHATLRAKCAALPGGER